MNETTQGQILNAIEDIVGSDAACDAEWMLRMHPEDMTEREKQYADMLSRVYMLAHGYNELHSCYNVHESWRTI